MPSSMVPMLPHRADLEKALVVPLIYIVICITVRSISMHCCRGSEKFFLEQISVGVGSSLATKLV